MPRLAGVAKGERRPKWKGRQRLGPDLAMQVPVTSACLFHFGRLSLSATQQSLGMRSK